MPCWATFREREKKNPKGSRPKESTKRVTPFSHSGIGEYGRRLGGSCNLLQIIFFFIEINPDRSLGMDSNYILVALFGLIFCVICTHNHYVNREFQSPIITSYEVNPLFYSTTSPVF